MYFTHKRKNNINLCRTFVELLIKVFKMYLYSSPNKYTPIYYIPNIFI